MKIVHFVCGTTAPDAEVSHYCSAAGAAGCRKKCPVHGYGCRIAGYTLMCEEPGCSGTFFVKVREEQKKCALHEDPERRRRREALQRNAASRRDKAAVRYTRCRNSKCGGPLNEYNREEGLCERCKPARKRNYIPDFDVMATRRESPVEFRAQLPHGAMGLLR